MADDSHLRELAARLDVPEYRVRTVDNTTFAVVLCSDEHEDKHTAWAYDERNAHGVAQALNEAHGY
jgi:hypothetical protein